MRRSRSLARSNVDEVYEELQLSKVLKDLSFIRIELEEVTVPTTSPTLEKYKRTGRIQGFLLEYAFPCLETVSKSLCTKVRIAHKYSTSTHIEFKHKRVNTLSMHEDIVRLWSDATLTIHLLVQLDLDNCGKFTTRLLAKCYVPLHNLLNSPFYISRDFDFTGQGFAGSALIRIFLGSNNRILMEKLNRARKMSADGTFTIEENFTAPVRSVSRGSSRCRSHSRSSEHRRRHAQGSRSVEALSAHLNAVQARRDENRSPSPVRRESNRDYLARPLIVPPEDRHRLRVPTWSRGSGSSPLMERNGSSSSLGSDSVFTRNHEVRNRENAFRRPPSAPSVVNLSPELTTERPNNLNWLAPTVSEEPFLAGKCHLQLTIHEASGLPPVKDPSGRIVAPNALISVRGREGELRSRICEATRAPRWNWTARFAVSSERRNIVIKVLHRAPDGDKPLGFVALSLPVANVFEAIYEITDVSQMSAYTSDVPMIKMSIENVQVVEAPIEQAGSFRPISSHSRRSYRSVDQGTQSSPVLPVDSPRILESRDSIKDRLDRNVSDLDRMMRNLQKH